MIVQWFADMFYKILTSLLGWINLPHLPDDVINTIGEYSTLVLDGGFALFYFFVPHNVIKYGIPILLIITAFKYGYFFVMWILKKIPMVGIE